MAAPHLISRISPLLWVATVLATPSAQAGDDGKRLLLWPVQADGLPKAQVQELEADLAAATADLGYRVLSAHDVRLLYEQDGESADACRDDDCLLTAAERLRGVELVAATLAELGGIWVINLRVYDVAAAVLLTRRTAAAGHESLRQAFGETARLVFGGQPPTSTATAFVLPGATQPLKVAVTALRAHGIGPELAETLQQVVAGELRAAAGLSVISKSEIEAMLNFEAQRQQLGCDDASCLAEIGGALGVDYVVSGSVGLLGQTYVLQLQLLRIAAARVDNRVDESFNGDEGQLLGAARAAARRLVGVTAPGTARVTVSSSVEDSEVQWNGTAAEATAVLPLGRQTLRVTADGYLPFLTDVYVEPGDANRVNAVLQAMPTPWYRAWWVWTGAAVVVAGGVAAAVLLSQPNEGSLTVRAAVPGSGS